jgi:spermidine synthase
MAKMDDAPIDVDKVEQRLRSPEYGVVAHSLSQIGFFSAIDLFGRFAAQGPELQPWLADAQVNRDRNLRLQYLAGFGLNAYEQARIYDEIVSYRQWPEKLFTGSTESLASLRAAIATAQ